jgi:hypothetical protein
MADKSQYYSLSRGVDYDILLKHFKNQADGVMTQHIITSRQGSNNSCTKVRMGRIIMVNKPKKGTKTVHDKTLDKVEVIDPTEVQRLRALNDIEVEVADINVERKIQPAHSILSGASSKTSGKRQFSQKSIIEKRKKLKKTVDKVIQRTKDVFDV